MGNLAHPTYYINGMYLRNAFGKQDTSVHFDLGLPIDQLQDEDNHYSLHKHNHSFFVFVCWTWLHFHAVSPRKVPKVEMEVVR